MIDATFEALRALHDLIVESEPVGCVRTDLGFRLTPTTAGSLGLAFDAPGPDDQVFSFGGRNVAFIDSRTAAALAGCTLDVDRVSAPSLILRSRSGAARRPRRKQPSTGA